MSTLLYRGFVPFQVYNTTVQVGTETKNPNIQNTAISWFSTVPEQLQGTTIADLVNNTNYNLTYEWRIFITGSQASSTSNFIRINYTTVAGGQVTSTFYAMANNNYQVGVNYAPAGVLDQMTVTVNGQPINNLNFLFSQQVIVSIDCTDPANNAICQASQGPCPDCPTCPDGNNLVIYIAIGVGIVVLLLIFLAIFLFARRR